MGGAAGGGGGRLEIQPRQRLLGYVGPRRQLGGLDASERGSVGVGGGGQRAGGGSGGGRGGRAGGVCGAGSGGVDDEVVEQAHRTGPLQLERCVLEVVVVDGLHVLRRGWALVEDLFGHGAVC